MSFADIGFGMDGAKVRLCRQERRTASVGGVIHVQKHAEPMMGSASVVAMTEAASHRSDLLDVRLRRIAWEAEGVLSLEFTAADGSDLPPFEPGAHVDLHLGDGLLRQYSLCGDPARRKSYRIGVREIDGGRVSRHIHRNLRPACVAADVAAAQ